MKHSAWMIVTLMISVLLTAGPAVAQTIYKVVDEHGNVTFTDQKPSEDAEPMKLPELMPATGRVAEEVIEAEAEDAPEQATERLQFRITSPAPDADVMSPDGSLTVELDSNVPIPSSAQVVLYINGVAQEPTFGSRIVVEEIGAGEHSLRAELQTASGRMLAISEEIYVRIHSLDAAD